MNQSDKTAKLNEEIVRKDANIDLLNAVLLEVRKMKEKKDEAMTDSRLQQMENELKNL
jgi:hypothetical protein